MTAHRAYRGGSSVILAVLAALLAAALTSFTAQPSSAATPQPDLEIPQYTLTTNVQPGDNTSYRFFVRNVGQVQAPAGVQVTFTAPTGFTIASAFSTNGIPFHCTHTATLATCVSQSGMPTDPESVRLGIGASSFFIAMQASRTPGLYKVGARIDPGNQVAESNEGNNLLQNAYRVGF